MERELRANFNLYLAMKDGETEEEAEDRVFKMLSKLSNDNKGFTYSYTYDSEVQYL